MPQRGLYITENERILSVFNKDQSREQAYTDEKETALDSKKL